MSRGSHFEKSAINNCWLSPRGFWLVTIGYLLVASYAFATDYSGSTFIVRDPIISDGGSRSTLNNFELYSSFGQTAAGTSSSSNFEVRGGFLFFPTVAAPSSVSATASNGQVALSWGASTGALGWVVSGYNVGQATGSGGPYTYTSVGNVTSNTRTGLTNGTTYYFVIRAQDALGISIATSSEVSATPAAPASSPAPAPAPPTGGGLLSLGAASGGGGGGGAVPSTVVVLKGRAYPNAQLNVFKDGSVVSALVADKNGFFEIKAPVGGGLYTFSVYAVDGENRRSLTTSFTLNASRDVITTISDIIVAPTISADKSVVKQGNDITFFGYTFPQSNLEITVNSDEPFVDATKADKTGYWNYALNSQNLERGDHTGKTQATTPDGVKSSISESIAFQVGDVDVLVSQAAKKPFAFLKPPAPPACSKKGDINNDKKINVVDFSILLFFWNDRNPQNMCADINGDGAVNLSDFSIMLFWWTG